MRGYGDYYGPVVAVAARAVKRASPGSVLVTREVREQARKQPAPESPALTFTSVGDHTLRGFESSIELFTVERV